MNLRTASRAVASIVIASLLVAIPGPEVWAQAATAARSASTGGSASAAGASATSLGAPLGTGFSIPSLALSAPGLAAPSAAPIPAELSAARLANLLPASPAAFAAAPTAAAANDNRSSISPAALVQTAAKPSELLAGAASELAPALAATNSPAASASDKGNGALNRLASLFDGLRARRPAQDAVKAGEPGDDPRGSGLKRAQYHLLPVLLTLADPGSPEALTAVLEKLHADTGFRTDSNFSAVRSPGLVTVRGLVPVSSLLSLKQTPGVVSIEGAAGGAAAPVDSPAAYAIAAAPARENLLRAGLRRVMAKSPMWGAIAMMPLQFAVMVAFMGPVMGAIGLGGTAAALKPWLLGTVAGMASLTYLAPFLSWIPVKMRAVGAFAAAGGVAWAFYAVMPGLPALWLAGNLVLGLFAALGSLQTLSSAANSHPVDKAVNSTEAAAFVNILGYQALLPILLMAGMLPLAYGILAVSTVLALSLLIKTGTKTPSASAPKIAPDVSVSLQGAPSAPETPEAPKPAAKPAAKAAAKKGREPFVPATRLVAEMEKLLKSNPDEALKVAAAAVVNEKERRSEVKIGAQRVMDALPIARTLPHYLDLLKLTARSGIQTSKDVNIDPWWYLQRTALRRLTREAAALTPASAELLDALKAAYKDRNASVRLAAAETLTALGVDPGPEADYSARIRTPSPIAASPSINQPQAPQKSRLSRWFPMLLLAGILGWMTMSNLNRPTPPPMERPAITQTIPGADSAKIAPSEAPLEQIAKDTKRTADAVERQAKAMEELAKPKGGGFLSGALMQILWIVVGAFIFIWIMRRFMGGGGGAAGGIQTKPKMDLERPTTRFDDVAGIDESMVEVQEIIDFLREPGRFKKLGARMPKGILMEGPPGTGKTLLARALAGETEATFISISGSDFVELYVGMGARRVRELFDTARKNAPAIIFIDEIDAVGKKRGDGGPGGGSHDEREQTINQILKEMDGFDNSSGVLVVAATNRIDTLDAALTRPGRFDRKIHVGLPEAMGREAILALHAKRARLGPDVDLRLIARRAAGLSGAFLENVINEAALLATRRGADAISAADIDEAVDRATIGGKRSLRLSEPLKRRIAAHEAGHVLANLLNENAEVRVPVNKVTIIPHGSGALGFAETGSEEGDKYLYTREELEARLDTILGGLVAEKIFYGGQWSTGPGSDLEAATRTARAMVQQLGMSELGLAQTAPNQYGQSAFGSEIDAKALAEVNKLLKASETRVDKRLRENADKHKAMIEALMEKETLSADEIEAIAHPKK